MLFSLQIAHFSLERAWKRTAAVKRRQADPDENPAQERAATEAAASSVPSLPTFQLFPLLCSVQSASNHSAAGVCLLVMMQDGHHSCPVPTKIVCDAQVVNQTSEVGDTRPLGGCAFSPDGAVLATGAWSGKLRLWNTADSAVRLTVQAHTDRITGAPPSPTTPQGRLPCSRMRSLSEWLNERLPKKATAPFLLLQITASHM